MRSSTECFATVLEYYFSLNFTLQLFLFFLTKMKNPLYFFCLSFQQQGSAPFSRSKLDFSLPSQISRTLPALLACPAFSWESMLACSASQNTLCICRWGKEVLSEHPFQLQMHGFQKYPPTATLLLLNSAKRSQLHIHGVCWLGSASSHTHTVN